MTNKTLRNDKGYTKADSEYKEYKLNRYVEILYKMEVRFSREEEGNEENDHHPSV